MNTQDPSVFMQKVHELATFTTALKHEGWTADDLAQIDLGRVFALQYLDDLRADAADSDMLMFGIAVAGMVKGEVLRGFLREISEALAGVRA